MDDKIKVFNSTEELLNSMSEFFFTKANQRITDNKSYTVALSGGSTPNVLYQYLATHHASAPEWAHTHVFWGDERMVPASSKESNYGTAKELMLDKITIKPENIHPVRGEAVPENEAGRYSCEIVSYVHEDGALPSFDLIMLGLGDDGHTASIFPNQLDLMYSGRVCDTAIHPQTGQERITLSGKTINNARNVVFLVTGEKKADIVAQILNKHGDYEKYPAAHIDGESVSLYWFLDADAAKHL